VGDLLRYVIVGLGVAWLAPWLFVRVFGRAAVAAPAGR
jgi:hypothetical protein